MNGYQIKRINEAQDNLDNLSDWENDFINNLAEKDSDHELTKKQNSVLNRISEKIGLI